MDVVVMADLSVSGKIRFLRVERSSLSGGAALITSATTAAPGMRHDRSSMIELAKQTCLNGVPHALILEPLIADPCLDDIAV
jgi:hypothetical protein